MNGSRVWVCLVLAIPLLDGVDLKSPALGDDAGALPRYRLQVGQELIYRGGSSFQYETGSLNYDNLDRAWVTRQNADGSWRVVVCYRDKMTQKQTPKVTSLKSALDAAVIRVQEVARAAAQPAAHNNDDDLTDARLGAFDLQPDGRTRLDESITQSYRPTDPETIFPLLPADAERAQAGWRSARSGLLEGQNDYRRLNQPGPDVIAADQHTPFDQVYLMTSTARFTFDPARGVIGRVDTTSTQGYGFEGKGTGELVLEQVVDHDAAWAKAVDREAALYFAAQKAHQAAMVRLNQGEGDAATLLNAATADLKAAQGRLTLPAFAGAIAAQVKQQEQNAKYYVEAPKARQQMIGEDAADWELKDLAGQTHTMRGYRGRVVVLDFWYRGCGWCIRAMPQMKQLADDFRDQPVTILGMNRDQDNKDAQFVADLLGLNYPTLVKAMPECEKYHVQGYPTLIVVDPQGKIAEFHFGYSPSLREEIGVVIRRLLPTAPGAALASPRAN